MDESNVLHCEVLAWRTDPKESSGWHIVETRGVDEVKYTVTGCNLPRPGARCELKGEWQDSERYGRQFFCRSVEQVHPPLSAGGVCRWLSDRCDGIGNARAAALLTHFGGDAAALWAALDKGPSALAGAPGISAELAEHIHQTYVAEGASREHYAVLRGWGLTQAQIARVLQHWPDVAEACRLLHADPYLLAEHVSGFAFNRADKIAREMGVQPQSRERVRAAILYCLEQEAGAGHTFATQSTLQHMSRAFLGVPFERALSCVCELRDANKLRVNDGARLYLPSLDEDESDAARGVLTLIDRERGERRAPVAIDWGPREPNAQQAHAVQLLADVSRRVAFVTGGPGTGKTTVLKLALNVLAADGLMVMLAAPTGKAAKRMTEATGLQAQTLHRLLQYRPEQWTDCDACKRASSGFGQVALVCDVLIIDEASMVDVQLWAALMRAVAYGGWRTAVRFVGDADQLPPVGPGQPFQDCLQTLGRGPEAERIARLSVNQRQAARSWVARSAPVLLAGTVPDVAQSPDFRFLEVDRADEVAPTIQRLLRGGFDCAEWNCSTLSADHLCEGVRAGNPAPVLAPQRTGKAGIAALNLMLHEHHNPRPTPPGATVELEDSTELRVGSWVMATKNDYQRNVRNGDTGVIEYVELGLNRRGVEHVREVGMRLDPDETTAKLIAEAERSGEDPPECPLIKYTGPQAREQLQLAYAMTIHKSQGSQYPWIVVVCHSTHTQMLTRRLLYTAITRSRQGLVLVGDCEGLAAATHNAREVVRRTWMIDRLGARP